MHVICKSCKEKFQVFPPGGNLDLGTSTLNLGRGSINTNKITFGPDGKLNFGPGGRVNFSTPSSTRYRCPSCSHEDEYSPNEIFDD